MKTVNRELKFRVWDDVDYMSSHFTLQDIQKGRVKFTSECTVMQFTGLTDKNGNEIYEGDILHFRTSRRLGFPYEGVDVYLEVRFGEYNTTDNTLHRGQGFYIQRADSVDSIHYIVYSHEACVIGNIHENPELIEQ